MTAITLLVSPLRSRAAQKPKAAESKSLRAPRQTDHRGFRIVGKTTKATALAQGTNPIASAGQYLMRIALMANIPNQNVLRRIKDVMQRHRQFDNAKG